jgi:hypothetical protein
MKNNNPQASASEEQQPLDVSSQLTEIANRGTKLSLGAQKLLLYEIIRAHQDALEHSRSGIGNTREFILKVAEAHSVKDLAAVFQYCGHKQMDRLHRSCEHLFAHGHETLEASTDLLLAALRGGTPTKSITR